MNFPPPDTGCNSSRATPSLRRNQHPATHAKPPNPAETHLSLAENCSNNRSQLFSAALIAAFGFAAKASRAGLGFSFL